MFCVNISLIAPPFRNMSYDIHCFSYFWAPRTVRKKSQKEDFRKILPYFFPKSNIRSRNKNLYNLSWQQTKRSQRCWNSLIGQKCTYVDLERQAKQNNGPAALLNTSVSVKEKVVPYRFLKVRGGLAGWGNGLKIGRSLVQFPVRSLAFFISLIFRAAIWPWGRITLSQ